MIIAMTADVLTNQRKARLRAGMDDYITKPIDAKALRERIARWLDARAA